ncbi:hypothetical protein ACFLZS_00970 [Patescibacteria group bacterium]
MKLLMTLWFLSLPFIVNADDTPPEYTYFSPYPQETDVPVDYPITFDVIDLESGVDPNLREVQFDGETIVWHGYTEPGSGYQLEVEEIPDGYRFILYHNPFEPDAEIPIAVEVDDIAENNRYYDCTYYTAGSSGVETTSLGELKATFK